MLRYHVDFETFSEADLPKVGAWAYSMHPSTEVLCMAYMSSDGTDSSLWLPGDDIPEFFFEADIELHAWNSMFEYSIWDHVMVPEHKAPSLHISEWRDTAALAAALALPRSLANCGEVIGLSEDKAKSKRGKYLIQRLCKPYRGKRVNDAELLQELYEYCQQDVVAEREISKKLRKLTPKEHRVWMLDQEINARGVKFDRCNVENAIDLAGQMTERFNAEVIELTKGQLKTTNQVQKLKDFLAKHGVVLDTLAKVPLSELLNNGLVEMSPVARRLIEIRLQLGKTSVAKYATLEKLLDDRDRAHGLLMYHGASTGRWSGKHFQPQNLPRPQIKRANRAIPLLRHRDPDVIEVFYDDTMEVLSSIIRGMIIASEGNRLIVADYSAIEARVLAWLAGQMDMVKVFRGDGKIYEHTASQIYKTDIDNIDKDQRFIGKVASLSLGYGGGQGAFINMADVYGVHVEAEFAEQIKAKWRQINIKITAYWYALEKAAVSAVAEPGEVFEARFVSFKVYNGFLFMKLPSGRSLAYPSPRLEEGKFGNDQVSYLTTGVNRKFERTMTYGGKLTENLCQAVARDIMAEAMLRLDNAGYPIVLTVHDEVIADTPKDHGSLDEFIGIMCELPSWARGLPLTADGYENERYKK